MEDLLIVSRTSNHSHIPLVYWNWPKFLHARVVFKIALAGLFYALLKIENIDRHHYLMDAF